MLSLRVAQNLGDIQRWPRKFGHGLKWSFCLTAAIMLQLRRDDDEENKT
jgi:hypothetical protein